MHPLSCRKLAPAGSDENVGFTHAFGSGCASAKSFLDVFIAVVVVVVVVVVLVVVVVVVAENNNNENNRKKIDDIALVARERPSRPREDTISSRARVTPSSPSLPSLSVEKNFFLLFFSRDALFSSSSSSKLEGKDYEERDVFSSRSREKERFDRAKG